MQEEIEHKTVNFAISTVKLSARTLLKGAQFFLRQYDKSASQGKQSMNRLIRQNRGVTNLEIEKTGIKDFDRCAKRYHIDYVLRIWNETKEDNLTQLIFCDMSTPKGDGSFNVYDDIRTKLLAAGVPESEVEFIHNADTEGKKADLFSKVRSGKVRVLLGSTAKMGAGTNVQTLLVAVHHLDVGWRPSDMTQRNGRIIRQGNKNKQVYVYNYVTEGTFDAYLWQTLENKQKFISQIMTSKSPMRSCDDVDKQYDPENFAAYPARFSGPFLLITQSILRAAFPALSICLAIMFSSSCVIVAQFATR